MFSLHVYELTFISGGGGDGDLQPMIAVQDSLSTFVFVKPLDIFDKAPWTLKIYKREPTGYF